jgi:hypothetical protein
MISPYRALQGFLRQARHFAVVQRHQPIVRGPTWAAVLIQRPYSYSGINGLVQQTHGGVRWGIVNYGRAGLWVIMATGSLDPAVAAIRQRFPLPRSRSWLVNTVQLGEEGSAAELPSQVFRPGIPLSVISTLFIYAGLSVAAQLVQQKPVLG